MRWEIEKLYIVLEERLGEEGTWRYEGGQERGQAGAGQRDQPEHSLGEERLTVTLATLSLRINTEIFLYSRTTLYYNYTTSTSEFRS